MEREFEQVKQVISKFEPISLSEMDAVKLMNRNDYKYIFNIKRLPFVLDLLSNFYKVLEIDDVRGANYKSIYFDTDNLCMFYDHHNGKPIRFKIRRREYVDSGLNFMEIKQKNSLGKTLKERVKQQKDENNFTEKTSTFIQNYSPFFTENLNPQLVNYFTRFTLVHKTEPERLTIDLNLTFSFEGKKADLPFLVIAEVKREGDPHKSTFMNMMRSMEIRQSGMSKYCLGTILLKPEVKHNKFKPNILKLKRIENDTYRN